MKYIISRGFTLPPSREEMDKYVGFNMWKSQLWPYRELGEGDILYWYEAPSQAIVWATRVRKVDKFPYPDKQFAADRLKKDAGNVAAEPYFSNAPPAGFCLAYVVEPLRRVRLPKPKGLRFPQQGWLRGNEEIAEGWLRRDETESKDSLDFSPALPLSLHQRYGRREAYGSVGISYNQQNRSLNTGLSPKNPDGGFFIFITLNKEDFDPRHDYEDQLFEDKLVWITRRGRSAAHTDYVKLREPHTRISLFSRLSDREGFVYMGELQYESHREFSDPTTGEVQQSYTWRLRTPVPEDLLRELTGGRKPRETESAGQGQGSEPTRRPSTFDEYRKTLSYALGSIERKLVPGHHNYQVRLKTFLAGHGVTPQFEKDFVDVDFELHGEHFIGEIKVTGFLRLNEAFRAALGQLLEYAYLRFETPPRLVMFLDKEPNPRRVDLASKFLISVVVENDGKYVILNPQVAPLLSAVFQGHDAEQK